MIHIFFSYVTANGFRKGAVNEEDLKHLKQNPEILMNNMTQKEIQIILSTIGMFEYFFNLKQSIKSQWTNFKPLKEFLFGADQDMLQCNRYDSRQKCALFTFIEDEADDDAFDFLSNEDTKKLWSSVFYLKDKIDGQNIEFIRKQLFQRFGLTLLIQESKIEDEKLKVLKFHK